MDLWLSNVQKVKLYDQVTAQAKYIKYAKLMGKIPQLRWSTFFCIYKILEILG